MNKLANPIYLIYSVLLGFSTFPVREAQAEVSSGATEVATCLPRTAQCHSFYPNSNEENDIASNLSEFYLSIENPSDISSKIHHADTPLSSFTGRSTQSIESTSIQSLPVETGQHDIEVFAPSHVSHHELQDDHLTSVKAPTVLQSSTVRNIQLDALAPNTPTLDRLKNTEVSELKDTPEITSENDSDTQPVAQSDDDGPGSRPRLRTEPESPNEPVFRPREDILLEQGSRYGPGISVLTPTAFGKSWGDLSVGVGFQERTRFTNSSDGAVGVGFGLGDAEKLVGLDVNITFTDLSDFFDRGIVSFKLHRRLPSNFAIAVGVNDALGWGNGDIDGPSPYGVVSKVINLRESPRKPLSRLALSAGVGTGRYRTIFDTEQDNDDPNIFGSIALRVADPVNIITEWTGQDLTVGLSLRPFPKIPFVITPAFTDITGNAGDGWRFILGAGYIFQF